MPRYGGRHKFKVHAAWMDAEVLDFIAAMSSTQVDSWNDEAGTLDDVSTAIRSLGATRKVLELAFSERPAVP